MLPTIDYLNRGTTNFEDLVIQADGDLEAIRSLTLPSAVDLPSEGASSNGRPGSPNILIIREMSEIGELSPEEQRRRIESNHDKMIVEANILDVAFRVIGELHGDFLRSSEPINMEKISRFQHILVQDLKLLDKVVIFVASHRNENLEKQDEFARRITEIVESLYISVRQMKDTRFDPIEEPHAERPGRHHLNFMQMARTLLSETIEEMCDVLSPSLRVTPPGNIIPCLSRESILHFAREESRNHSDTE